ncbi:saccharopine dehydrogenase NADP-binding domain-containing protein, partial [Mycobacterium kansasii]
DWPLISADATSESSLKEMAARTQVVITTVGPYTRYGLPLVAACAAAGTDYADLTGEANFVRESIDLYHKQAADTGARI